MERPGSGRTTSTRFALVRVRDGWRIVCDGRALDFADTKGLGYLALLLAHPGERLHVLDLTTRVGGSDIPRGSAPAVPGAIPRARTESRGSADDLGTGAGATAVERARKRVAIAVRRAIAAIEAVCPELGEHLRQRVRLGGWCEYHAARGSGVRCERT